MKNTYNYLILILTFISSLLYSQKETNIWYFGYNAGVDFNTGSPVALTNGMLSTNEGCATICDNTGALLFYTDGVTVYNKNHLIMPNGTGLLGNSSSTQSSIVVQRPGAPSKYYIFTTDATGGFNGFCYSELDMTLASGLGDVTSTKNVLIKPIVSEKITTVRHQNGVDVWIITTNLSGNNLYAYLLTSSGINTTPVVSSAGSVASGSSQGVGYLKASLDGKLLAQAIDYDANLDVMHFNTTTGVASTWFTYTGFSNCYGLEFSPDNSKLYITSEASLNIQQLDLSSAVPATIIASSTVIGIINDPTGIMAAGALQLGPDKKIYTFAVNGSYLSCISNPNGLGSASSFVNNAVNLLGKHPFLGLPNFMPSLLNDATVTYANLCAGSPTNFFIDNTNFTSVLWNFGDPTSGALNTASTFTASHTYNTIGSYTTSAVVSNSASISNTVTSIVNIIASPTVNLGPDLYLCPLSSSTLSVSANYSSVWQDATTNNTQVINAPGKYWVKVSNACGSASDTVLVTLLTKPVSNILDTIICTPSGQLQLKVTNATQVPQTYNWYDNSTNITHEITKPGSYWVDITNSCGTIRDSIYVKDKNCEIIIPNVITSNNDNVNDVFIITGLQTGVAKLSIINRWGIVVYSSSNYNNDWKPSDLNDGVYFYILDYPITNMTYKGFLTIFN